MDHLREFDEKRARRRREGRPETRQGRRTALERRRRAAARQFHQGNASATASSEVRVSKRLVGSPAVVVDKDTHMTTEHAPRDENDEQREGGAEPSTSKPDLEINPDHADDGRA